MASALQNLALDTEPRWQFEGDRGAWHDFKRRVSSPSLANVFFLGLVTRDGFPQSGTPNECSVTSDEIERKFTQNPDEGMTFKVGRYSYKLDFQGLCLVYKRLLIRGCKGCRWR